jgi:hypothetical protein
MQPIRNRYTVALGIAFITQFLTSIIGGLVLWNPIANKSDISETMLSISQHYIRAHLSIFLGVVTIVAVVWLGILLWGLLRKVNPVWAMTGMVLYIIEMVMWSFGVFSGYALLYLSAWTTNSDGQIKTLGAILLKLYNYTQNMAIIPFVIGAFLFYYLFYKSKALPSWIPIWGFLSVILTVIVPLNAYGVGIPFWIVFPYVPFELFIGIYILVKGLSSKSVIWQ